jgi:minor curlin subunit
MKTLKLQLLAASMFACATAFAQGSPNAAPALGTRTANTAAANFATGPNAASNSQSFNSSREGYRNDSYVLQQGETQYARVDQMGGANQADIIQGPSGQANNAFQTQNYNTAGGRKNIGYIYQNGTSGTATQEQTGSSNTASVQQYGTGDGASNGTGNTAFQRQNGDENTAGIQQYNGDRDQAIQFQSGDKNYSTISQSNGSLNRAETNQTGTSNAAIVTQH